MKISRQNILKINEGKSLLEMCEGREQMQQHIQNNGRELGSVGYAMWKSDTKSVVWVSSDVEIHSDLSPMSSYPNQITLYRSLHAHRWLILESTIQEISYSSSSSIMTGAKVSQISYSLVVILELSGVLEVQYKEIMMSSINKDNWRC